MCLEMRDLWKSYPNQSTPAVQGITLQFQSQRITALAGESGSGKTTLLRLIAGFVCPDRGVIANRGRELAGPTVFVQPQNRSVAMIFQDLALFPHMTAKRNVAFGFRDGTRRDRPARVASILNTVGLSELAEKYPHELSGGQRQRVALARALASKADTILMDEPFSNLDPELKVRMMVDVRTILKNARRTVIFVTHDRDEAFAFADDIAIIRAGRLLQHGEARDVYRQPASHAVARFFGRINRIPEGFRGTGLPREELLVRPELCLIVPRNGSPGPADGLPGIVSASRFMGEYWETEVRPVTAKLSDAESMTVRDFQSRQPGQNVWVILPTDSRDIVH